MLRTLIIAFTLFLLVSCQKTNTETDDSVQQDNISQSELADTTTQFRAIWAYDPITEIPKKLKPVNSDTLTPEKLIELLNQTVGRGKVYLEFVKIKTDTIFVAIKESTFLTQRMGTTGADEYISTTVYTLTELKNIKNVNFKFLEGDHARPGTYNRQLYMDRRKTADKTE